MTSIGGVIARTRLPIAFFIPGYLNLTTAEIMPFSGKGGHTTGLFHFSLENELLLMNLNIFAYL